jgi:DNA invertase Pin-like site-specific DNA recombinase
MVARARGRKGGRPKALTGKQLSIAQDLYDDPNNSIAEICRTLKISKATLYRAIKTGEDAGRP